MSKFIPKRETLLDLKSQYPETELVRNRKDFSDWLV